MRKRVISLSLFLSSLLYSSEERKTGEKKKNSFGPASVFVYSR